MVFGNWLIFDLINYQFSQRNGLGHICFQHPNRTSHKLGFKCVLISIISETISNDLPLIVETNIQKKPLSSPVNQLIYDCFFSYFLYETSCQVFSISLKEYQILPCFLFLLPLPFSLFFLLILFPMHLLHNRQVNFPNAHIRIYYLPPCNS